MRQLPLLSAVRRFRGPLLLLALVAAANFNIIFLGQTLVATSNANPLSNDGWALRAGDFRGRNPSVNWFDAGGAWWQWEPAGHMMSRAFRRGRIPLWDPEVGGGVNAYANLIPTQYYPPYMLLLLAGDLPLLRDAYYLAEIFVAGLFPYLLFRANGCRQLPSVAAGAGYMLGGAMTQTVNSSIGQSFAVLPMMVWATHHALDRRTWRAAATAAAVMGLAASSSFLPVVISGYVLAALYAAVFLFWNVWAGRGVTGAWRVEILRGTKVAVAIALSLLLVAFLLIPVARASALDTNFDRWYSGLGRLHISFGTLLALVSPSIGNDVSQLHDPGTQLFQPPPYPAPFYAGTVSLLLACLTLGGGLRQQRCLLLFFAAATALVSLKLIGAPPVQWIAYLPVFRQIHFVPYFYGALGFGVAGLAGLGLQAVYETQRPERMLGIGIAAVVTLFVAIWVFAAAHEVNPALAGQVLEQAHARYRDEVHRVIWLAVIFAAAVVGFRFRWLTKDRAALLLLALMAFELISLDVRQRFLRSDVWSDPPLYVRFLQQAPGKFRVVSPQDAALPADTSEAEALDVVSSRMAFNSPRYADIVRRYFAAPKLPYPVARDPLNERAVLDLLNAGYVVVPAADFPGRQKAERAGLPLAYESASYRVYRNPTVWPRAYLARAVRTAGSAEDSLAAMPSLQRGEVLLEEERAVPPDVGQSKVDLPRYEFGDIDIRVHAEAGGLLVLGENADPGWSAKVNGGLTRILRANYAFQAVEVPRGDSLVQFRYQPPGLGAGLGISLVAAGLVIALWQPWHSASGKGSGGDENTAMAGRT